MFHSDMQLSQPQTLAVRLWYGTTPAEVLARNIRVPVDALHAEAVRLGMTASSAATKRRWDLTVAKETKAPAKKPAPKMVQAMRQATELLRAGDHVGALDVLEGVL